MKTKMNALIVAAIVILTAGSCKKNNSSTTKPGFTLSKSSIKIGEPLIATANGGAYVKWSVKSTSSVWISRPGNKSAIIFSASGSYNVNAAYYVDSISTSPYDSSSLPVMVTSGVYSDSSGSAPGCSGLIQDSIKVNEQINITPVNYSDTGLVLVAHTQNTYGNYYPLLNYSGSFDSATGYKFIVTNVSDYPCGKATDPYLPATAIFYFGNMSAPLKAGTYNIEFSMNGTQYNGTLTVSSTSCTFNWSYSSGIIIAPSTIQKS